MEPVRVTPDDELIVDRYASTTDSVLLIMRMSEDKEGKRMRPRPVVFDIAHVAGDRALEATVFGPPTGWIQSGYVRNNGTVERGTFYVEVLMRAFGLPHTQLAFGQVYDGHNLALGVFEDPLASPGRVVTNDGATTLVNNTAVTRTIACPTNARWLWKGGTYTNADDVTRNITVRVTDGTNEIFRIKNVEPCETLIRQVYPSSSDSVPVERLYGVGAMAVDLLAAFDIEITWAAGGASAGGTARSTALVEEWIET